MKRHLGNLYCFTPEVRTHFLVSLKGCTALPCMPSKDSKAIILLWGTAWLPPTVYGWTCVHGVELVFDEIAFLLVVRG